MKAARVITAILLAMGLSAVGFAGSAAAAPGSGLGVAAPGTLLTLPQPDLDRELEAASSVGASWIRVEVSWRVVEPTPGAFDWSNVDRVVDTANRHGLKVLGLVGYAPPWASTPGPTSLLPGSRPADPVAFGNFAGVAAARYAGRIGTWEVWNEPNIAAFFAPGPDVELYSQILRTSYQRIHAAVGNVTVLSGGLSVADDGLLSVSPKTFIDGLYARGLAGYSDGIALHPYTFPFETTNDPNGNWADLSAVRDSMVRNGDAGKKIWITEFGAPTGTAPDAVSDDIQSRIVVDALRASEALDFTGPFFVYSVRDSGPNIADREQNFGLLRGDFSRKPAADALSAEAK
ncbi:beta-galactosidase [Actinomycetes bacterium M1A6_2h]